MDSFFSLSKLFWFLCSPDHLLVWGVLLGVLLLWRGRRRAAGLVLGIDLALWLALLLFPLGDLLLMPLERRFPAPPPPSQVAGIIILGGGELAEQSAYWGQPQFNQAAERLMLVPELAQRYPQARILFSGGSGSLLRQQFRGGDAARDYFERIGLGGRVQIERDSRNTDENARHSIAALGGIPSGRWLLVTSAYHMPRSIGVFRRQGWELTPWPVDYYALSRSGLRLDPQLWRNLRDLQIGLREWIGLLAYRLSAKTDALFPAPVSRGAVDPSIREPRLLEPSDS